MMSSHSIERVTIDWQAPAPRSGSLGAWDRFVGPGATVAENILILGTTLGGAVLIGPDGRSAC
ncbi:MAG: hypothetical protein WAU39_09335 [Polyangiales bacterium]